MITLWNERLRKHQKEQFKYLRLVFNDFFVVSLIFMLGAFGYWYSTYLKTINSVQPWAKYVVAAILAVSLFIGQLATMLEKADMVFLLPKEKQLIGYLLKARNYSLILPIVFIVLIEFVVSPYAVTAAGFTMNQYLMVCCSIVLIKIIMINTSVELLYYKDLVQRHLNWLFIILGFLTALFYQYATATLIAWLVVTFISFFTIKQVVVKGRFNWEIAIDKENERSFSIKRFYNLFTDVPGLSSKISRRKYLDGLLKLIPEKHEHTFLYLYARGFIRNNEYIGLFLRLTIVGALVLVFIDNRTVSLIILLLFIYLVGFQMKPFYNQYSYNDMQKLYPVKANDKKADFLSLMRTVLLIQLVISVISIFIRYDVLTGCVMTVVGIIFIWAMVRFYFGNELKKVK